METDDGGREKRTHIGSTLMSTLLQLSLLLPSKTQLLQNQSGRVDGRSRRVAECKTKLINKRSRMDDTLKRTKQMMILTTELTKGVDERLQVGKTR